MRKSCQSDSSKHPVILPKTGIAIQRLIEHYHQVTGHGGRTLTINALRSGDFWLIGANTRVRKCISQCVLCRKFRGSLGQQKMADLPHERSIDVAPFTHCGLDMFGPFYVKEGRKRAAKFVALFTCFSCRAIHLEHTSNMSTDSFILALRRFLSRRGPVKSITSDNGTNFVGAENEFRKAYREMEHTRINNFLVSKSCDWITWQKNPPEASHMGGVWERQIRTVRQVLTSLLNNHSSSLDTEALHTLLTESESIVNSRPLTTECLHDPTLQPLSPQQLLTMKSKPVFPPPGYFSKEDLYSRRRWRQVQHLANEFWTRWKKEYLSTLQSRQKWIQPQRNFMIGDIVIIKDSGMHRQEWPLAKVVNVFPDASDGLVRKVELMVPSAKNNLKRPIHKIVLLVESEN